MNEPDIPITVRAELLRLRAEHQVLHSERERLLDELRQADADMRTVVAERESGAARAAAAESELGAREAATTGSERALREHAALLADIERLHEQAEQLHAELARARDDRDRLQNRVLRDALARPPVIDPDREEPSTRQDAEHAATVAEHAATVAELAATVAELEATVAELEATVAELEAVRATVSWRVTAPLRLVRSRTVGHERS